jgi:hypothetical protein
MHPTDDRHHGSSCDPAGLRTYLGGASDANAPVRRLIPNCPAISRCDTPSLANVLISAHSNAAHHLSQPSFSSLNTTSLRAGSVATEIFDFSKWRTIGRPASPPRGTVGTPQDGAAPW